jgi:tripartite-type tricarboxylate transporter receptor subunit TctC
MGTAGRIAMSKRKLSGGWRLALAIGMIVAMSGLGQGIAAAWEPTKPVEFVVPAGTGGGADIMARFISPLIEKHKLSPRPFIVANRAGGAGAEGFLYVKGKVGDPHIITLTLDNLFATPLATGVPFNWKDLTPVSRLALDYFVLWVNAETPYKTAREYLEAVKAKPTQFKMGGTGTAQEDQIITIQMEQAFGLKFIYVPFKGGGDVAVSLVGKHTDSTVNNPSEAVGHWKAGRLRPLATIDHARIDLPDWRDIPTMKEAMGFDMSYLMLRGIFVPPGVPKEAQEWYANLFQKLTETPEWKKYMADNALKPAFLAGPDYPKWLGEKEALTKDLMQKGGLIKK